MTKKQKVEAVIKFLDAIDGEELEQAHGSADHALQNFVRDIGYPEVYDAYDRVSSRCEWWACA